MLTFFELLIWFLPLTVVVVLIYLIGHVVVAFYHVKFTELSYDLLTKLLVGTFISVLLFSIIRCSFITFNAILIPILGIIYFTRRQSANFYTTNFCDYIFDFHVIKNYRVFLYLTVFAILFILRSVWLMDADTSYLFSTLGNADNDDYAQLSDAISFTGQENRYLALNFWDERAHGLTPYHYFELWVTAFLGAFLPVSTMYVYMVFTFSFLMLILFFGYESLLIAINKKYHRHYAGIAFVFLFSSIIYWDFFLDYGSPMVMTQHFIYGDHAIPFFNIKALVPELILVVFIILLRNEQHQLAILFILVFPVVTFLATPSIFGGILLTLILNLKYKFLNINSLLSFGTTIGIAFLLIILWRLNAPTLVRSETNIAATGFFSYIESDLIIFAWRSFKALIHIPYIYSPFSIILIIVLIFYREKYSQRNLCIIGLPNVFIFIVGWGISRINPAHDWGQFFTVVSYGLGKIGFTVLLWAIVDKLVRQNRVVYFLIILCFGWLLFRVVRNMQLKLNERARHSYSKVYLKKVNEIVSKQTHDKPFVGGFITNKSYYTNHLEFRNLGVARTRGLYLMYMRQDVFIIPLSVYHARGLHYAAELNPVVLYFKKNPEYRDYDKRMVDFVRERNLDFLVINSDATYHPSLDTLILKEVRDERSGTRFCLLKKQ